MRLKIANDPIKKKVDFRGLKIDLEWPRGSTRTYADSDFKRLMMADYGYLRGTNGEDGEELDIYIGDDHASTQVYIVAQLVGPYEVETNGAMPGDFDEFKVILGCGSRGAAEGLYKLHMPAEQMGEIWEMHFDEFKEMVLPLLDMNGHETPEEAKERVGDVPPEHLRESEEVDAQSVKVTANYHLNVWVAPDGTTYESGHSHDRWALQNQGATLNDLLDQGWIRVAPPDAVQVRSFSVADREMVRRIVRDLMTTHPDRAGVWVETDADNLFVGRSPTGRPDYGEFDRGAASVRVAGKPTKCPLCGKELDAKSWFGSEGNWMHTGCEGAESGFARASVRVRAVEDRSTPPTDDSKKPQGTAFTNPEAESAYTHKPEEWPDYAGERSKKTSVRVHADTRNAGMVQAPPAMLAKGAIVIEQALKYFTAKKLEGKMRVERSYYSALPAHIKNAEADLDMLAENMKEMDPGGRSLMVDLVDFMPDSPLRYVNVERLDVKTWKAYRVIDHRPSKRILAEGAFNDVFQAVHSEMQDSLEEAEDTLRIHQSEEGQEMERESDEYLAWLEEQSEPIGYTSGHGRSYVTLDIPLDLTGWKYADQLDATKLPSHITLVVYPWVGKFTDGDGKEKGAGGFWHGSFKMVTIHFDYLPLGGRQSFARELQEKISTLEHELVHAVQTLIQEGKGLQNPGGLPAKERYDQTMDHKRPHEQRSIEFFPNLTSELREFQRQRRNLANDPMQYQEAARQWVSESHRFEALKKSNPDNWQKAVREFMRAVTTPQPQTAPASTPVTVTAAGVVDLKGLDALIAAVVADALIDVIGEEPPEIGVLRGAGGRIRITQEDAGYIEEFAAIAQPIVWENLLGRVVGMASLSTFVDDSVLSKSEADALFKATRLAFDSTIMLPGTSQSASGYFSAPRRGRAPGEVHISLPRVILAVLRHPSGRAHWSRESILEEVRETLAHEMRHAADYAYQTAARPGKFQEENEGLDPEFPYTYYNTPTELRSYAADVAQRVFNLNQPRPWQWRTQMTGQDIISWAEMLHPRVFEHLDEDNRKEFLQRVVKTLELLDREWQAEQRAKIPQHLREPAAPTVTPAAPITPPLAL